MSRRLSVGRRRHAQSVSVQLLQLLEDCATEVMKQEIADAQVGSETFADFYKRLESEFYTDEWVAKYDPLVSNYYYVNTVWTQPTEAENETASMGGCVTLWGTDSLSNCLLLLTPPTHTGQQHSCLGAPEQHCLGVVSE